MSIEKQELGILELALRHACACVGSSTEGGQGVAGLDGHPS